MRFRRRATKKRARSTKRRTGLKRTSFKRRKTYTTRHVSVRRHHKHVKTRIAGGYRRLNTLQADRYHVKLVFDGTSYQPIQFATNPVGAGWHEQWTKLKMNGVLRPGSDWTSSLAYAFDNPSDIQDYCNHYSSYRVSSAKVEYWIDPSPFAGGTSAVDTDTYANVNFDVVTVPLPFNISPTSTTIPFTGFEQASAQPYAKVKNCRYLNSTTRQYYIKRFVNMGKLYGEPDMHTNGDWGGVLGSSIGSSSGPPRLQHMYLGLRYFDATDTFPTERTWYIKCRITMYTTLFGRRITPDPGIQTLANELGAQASAILHEEKKALKQTSDEVKEEEEKEMDDDDVGELVHETKLMSVSAAPLETKGVLSSGVNNPKTPPEGGSARKGGSSASSSSEAVTPVSPPADRAGVNHILRRLLTNAGLPKPSISPTL